MKTDLTKNIWQIEKTSVYELDAIPGSAVDCWVWWSFVQWGRLSVEKEATACEPQIYHFFNIRHMKKCAILQGSRFTKVASLKRTPVWVLKDIDYW